MNQLPPDLARLTGLVCTEPPIEVPRPTGQTGQGFVAPSPDRLADLDIEATVPRRVLAELELFRLDHDPDLFVLEAPGLASILQGRSRELQPGVWLLDSGDGATIQLADWLVHLERGQVRAWPLQDDGSAVSPQVSSLPEVSWPGAEALLAGWTVAPWLTLHSDRLGSGPPVDRVAAAGALARHWSPQTSQDRRKAVQAIGAGTTVQHTVREWLAQLAGWEGLDPAITARVGPHVLRVKALSEAASLEDPAAVLRSLVQERDHLESLRVAARLASRPTVHALEAGLERADRTWASQLSVVGQFFDPASLEDLLRSVAAREADQWWGGLL